ncbi:MAG: XTP/dITP diphosphatase [Abditibacteriota bacterium]|jgi:XTP/dITP diphosphohydrolase|nr:XTP/dITP diphosphatase [Abditibacteriota bacterium]
MKLLVATGNQGKAREIRRMLGDLPYQIVTLADLDNPPEVEETGSTFLENAMIKAAAYSEFSGMLTLADDSGLAVDALGGAPGVYSARFAPTDDERIEKLLGLMEEVPEGERTARFVCAMALSNPSGEMNFRLGTIEGVIIREKRGDGGFGYDPVFFVPEAGKTMSEMTAEEKNEISHRARAFAQIKEIL